MDQPIIVDAKNIFTSTQHAVVAKILIEEKKEHNISYQVIIEENSEPELLYVMPEASSLEPIYQLEENPKTHHITYAQQESYRFPSEKLSNVKDIKPELIREYNKYVNELINVKLNNINKTNVASDIVEAIKKIDGYRDQSKNEVVDYLVSQSNISHPFSWFTPLLRNILFIIFGLSCIFNYGKIQVVLYTLSTIRNKPSKLKDFLFFSLTRYGINIIIDSYKENIKITLNRLSYKEIAKLLDKNGDTIYFNIDIVDIRNILFKKNKKETWRTVFNDIDIRLKNISERSKLYNEYQKNSEVEDKEKAFNKISSDMVNLMLEVSQLKISLLPKMDKSIKAKIMGEEIIASSISILVNERVNAIASQIELAEKSLPHSMNSEIYTITEMRTNYLPDTLQAYLEAKKHDPITAEKLFNDQLETLETAIEDTIQAIREKSIDKLKINGNFLKERFRKS